MKIAAAKNKVADAAGSVVEAMSPEETEKWLDEQITKKLEETYGVTQDSPDFEVMRNGFKEDPTALGIKMPSKSPTITDEWLDEQITEKLEKMGFPKDSPDFEEIKSGYKKNPAELGIQMPSTEGYNGSINKLASSDDVIKLYDNIETENTALQKYWSEVERVNNVDAFADAQKITDKAVDFSNSRNVLVENDILGQEVAGLGKKDMNAVLRNTPDPKVVETLIDRQ